jgi:hypothetical protein
MAATAYYTDNYKAATVPDFTKPAGALLAQAVKFTASSAVYVGDTIYLFRLPAGAVLVDIKAQFPAGSSVTMSLGTVTYSTGATVSATNIVNAAVCTGAGRFSLAFGFQGTSRLTTALLGGAIGPGSKFTVDTGILMTNAGAALTDDDNLYFVVLYYMDHGEDRAYDAVDA